MYNIYFMELNGLIDSLSEFYDFGGPQVVVHTVFENFVSYPQRPAGAIGFLEVARNELECQNQLHNLTFINADEVWYRKR